MDGEDGIPDRSLPAGLIEERAVEDPAGRGMREVTRDLFEEIKKSHSYCCQSTSFESSRLPTVGGSSCSTCPS
jgi:hypothetical protein